MQAVDPAFAGFDAVRGIVLLDAAFGIVDIFADQVDTAVFIQHLRRTEPHAGHVDTPSASRGGLPTPACRASFGTNRSPAGRAAA